jgi:hypothetical protein
MTDREIARMAETLKRRQTEEKRAVAELEAEGAAPEESFGKTPT